jgi:predicted  nucleic acid-binding Zn-ribbon protein
LTNLLTNPENVEDGLLHMTEESDIQAASLREELEIVDDLLATVNHKIEWLVAAFSDEEDDVTAEALQKSYKEKAELKSSLDKQRQNLVAQLNQLEIFPSLIDEIISITTKIATLLSMGSYAKRHHILDVLNVNV